MNVSNQITEIAAKFPHKRAVCISDGKNILNHYRYSHYTFAQFEKRINKIANALIKFNVKKADRVLLFVKPSLDFSAITFALFKIGAIPVLIDPGMGVKNFLNAVQDVNANVLIGIPKAHLLAKVFASKFKNVKIFISVSKNIFFKNSLAAMAPKMPSHHEARKMNNDDTAAILFTSGGTGRPKGVVYTHEIFIKQTQMLQNEFNLTSDDTDIPGFPLFALFTLAMGMTSCIPDMDPSKPAKANPKKIVQNIIDQGATFVAGSPAIWKNVLRYCKKNNLTLPSIKYLVMFGAPIPVSMHEDFKKILTNGTTYTPYGATECLPVSNISGIEILKETKDLTLKGLGTCIGKPLDDVEVRIIPQTDIPIEDINQTTFLSPFSKGEIVVKSKVVTPKYFMLPEKTNLAKIKDGDSLWHRMGDIGYMDDKDRLWFCGRKAHVINIKDKPMYSIPVEEIFNQHPQVLRSALVKSSNDEPAVVIERKDKKTFLDEKKKKVFFDELKNIAKQYDHTKEIRKLFLYKNFPVDVRHNIKIDRQKLTQWVRSQGH